MKQKKMKKGQKAIKQESAGLPPKEEKISETGQTETSRTDDRRYPMLFVALILITGVIAYSNSFDCSFHFDDANIFKSEVTRESASIKDWISLFPARPVGISTFALNYHFHKLNVRGYHVVNLMIHLTNALLVWWLTLLILSSPAMKDQAVSRHKNLIAFLTGLLFVSHPLATQSVTYIAQRFASLATMFYLLTLALYAKGRLWKGSANIRWFFYGGSIVFAVLGMLTKEIVFTLPFAVLLCEFCFFRTETWTMDARNKGLLISAAILVLAILLFFRNNSLNIFDAVPPAQGYAYSISAKDYLLTQFSVIVTYIRLLFLPINQNLDYDYPVSQSLFDATTLLSLSLLMGILIVGVLVFRRYRLIAFGIFWFFLTLSVESSIVPISQNVIFEHRTYLPSFGFFLALTGAGFYFLQDKYMKVAVGVLLLLAGINSVLTFQRNKVWKDDYSLWTDCVKKSPNKARALNSLGKALTDRGDMQGAMKYFDRTVTLNPGYDLAYYNRGRTKAELGDYPGALADFDKVLKITPSDASAYYNRAYAKTQLKDYIGAIDDYGASLKFNPNDADAYVNLGNLKAAYRKDFEGSVQAFTKAIALDRNNALAYANRGNSKYMMKNQQGACDDWHAAARMGHEQVRGAIQAYCR